MLTKSCCKATSAKWLAAYIAAVTLSGITFTSAQAQGVVVSGCVGGGWFSVSCVRRWGPAEDPYVRLVPQSADSAEQERATERDRKWLSRCQPVVRDDRYGVARYEYAAPGCEFGVGED